MKQFLILMILLFTTTAFTQTTQWRVIWNANPEADNVLTYEVYRGTSPNPTTQIGIVNSPDTSYVDNTVNKGTEYFYNIIARNANGPGPSSDDASAAIPLITPSPLPPQVIESDSLSITVDLNGWVYDPDNPDNEIEWLVTNNPAITVVVIDANNHATIGFLPGIHGLDTLTFSAYDDVDEGFYDVATMEVTKLKNPDAPLQIRIIR